MALKIKNRFAAGLFHFSLSFFIFSIFIFVLLKFWYPAPYFTASGGWQGLKIVAAIDLVMGPALTLIVFNTKKSKKELFLDFSIIAFMQVAALLWGITTIYNQRPIAAVFWDNGFYTVPASALLQQGINLEELEKFGTEKPVYIYAQQPQTAEQQEALIASILKDKIPPYQQLYRFKPIEQHYEDIYKHNVDILEIISTNSDMKDEIDEVLKKTGTSLHDNHYIALISKYRNIILVYNQDNQLTGTASASFKDKN